MKLVNGILTDLTAEDLAQAAIDRAAAISAAPNLAIKAQIKDLEASITDRRIREAILGVDNGWLSGLSSQIATLRAQLT